MQHHHRVCKVLEKRGIVGDRDDGAWPLLGAWDDGAALITRWVLKRQGRSIEEGERRIVEF